MRKNVVAALVLADVLTCASVLPLAAQAPAPVAKGATAAKANFISSSRAERAAQAAAQGAAK